MRDLWGSDDRALSPPPGDRLAHVRLSASRNRAGRTDLSKHPGPRARSRDRARAAGDRHAADLGDHPDGPAGAPDAARRDRPAASPRRRARALRGGSRPPPVPAGRSRESARRRRIGSPLESRAATGHRSAGDLRTATARGPRGRRCRCPRADPRARDGLPAALARSAHARSRTETHGPPAHGRCHAHQSRRWPDRAHPLSGWRDDHPHTPGRAECLATSRDQRRDRRR